MNAAQIQVYRDGSFQRDSHGKPATLLPVEMDGGAVIDTVAWFEGRAGAWWLERRIGSHLGDKALKSAAFFGRPVRLLATPAQWLASPDEAVVILDWQGDLRRVFRDVPTIVCASDGLAKHLNRRLNEQVRHTYEIRVAA
jgi:hypothetical protein